MNKTLAPNSSSVFMFNNVVNGKGRHLAHQNTPEAVDKGNAWFRDSQFQFGTLCASVVYFNVHGTNQKKKEEEEEKSFFFLFQRPKTVS